MKKIISTLFLVLFTGLQHLSAQQLLNDTAKVSREARHHFLVQLPQQISFKVSLIALADWDGNDFFNFATDRVKKHIDYFKDSMNTNPDFQNRLYIEQRENTGFEKLNFRQVRPENTELVFKDDNYYNLKNTMDSLFYTKYIPDPKATKGAEDSLRQTLIVITAKSLQDLNALSTVQIREVRQQLDSMVNAAKLKSSHYRSSLYSSSSSWSLSSTGARTSGFKDQKPFMGVVNNFKIGVSYGAIVFNNSISPTMELSLGYVLKRSQQNALFIGLNYSLFSEIDLRNRNNLVSYLPINFEFGTIRNNIGLMQRKTSIGYGVMLKTTNQDGLPTTHYLANMQLNFALSNTISSSLIMATQFKKDPEHYVFGVSLKYNL